MYLYFLECKKHLNIEIKQKNIPLTKVIQNQFQLQKLFTENSAKNTAFQM
jgi:hypothetical protein